jgi:hypothetical protein
MFSKLSENRDRAKGKLANEMTLKNTATQYQIGRPEWTGSWESHTHDAFKVSQVPINPTIELSSILNGFLMATM